MHSFTAAATSLTSHLFVFGAIAISVAIIGISLSIVAGLRLRGPRAPKIRR